MPSVQAVPPEQIAELIGKLAGLRWSWSVAELGSVFTPLCWSLDGEPEDFGVILVVGRDSVHGYAEAAIRAGAVAQLRFTLTGGASGSGADVRRDVFAAVERAATEKVGPPTLRLPGARSEIRWTVPGGVLQVIDNGHFVELSLLSPALVEWLDEVAEEFEGVDAEEGGDLR